MASGTLRSGKPRRNVAGSALVRDEFRYLSVAPCDRRWGLFVTAAGSQFIPPDSRFRSQGHSPTHDYVWQRGRVLQEYSIVYVIRGEGEFESKHSGKKNIAAGSVLYLFPNVWHRYRPIEQIGFDSYWVMFQGDYADRLCKQGFLAPNEPVLDVGIDELILHPFINLLDRVRSQPLGLQQLLAADTMAIIAGIRSAVHRQQTKGHIQEAVRLAKMAMETADALPAIDDIVADSGLSRSHFYQAFKGCTGVSPYQYHLQLRMSRAKEMLRGSALSIKQITATLNFSSVYQFSRMFKKKTGMSPTDYRRGTLGL